MVKHKKTSPKETGSLGKKITAILVVIILLIVGYILITGRATGLISREAVAKCESPLVSDFNWQNKNAFYDQVTFLVQPRQSFEDWADLEKAKKYIQLRVNDKYAATTYTDIRETRSISNGYIVTLDTKKLKSGAKQKIDVTAINQLTKGRMCLTAREYIVSSIGEVEEITSLSEQDKELDKFPEIALADRIYYPSACKRKNFLDVPRAHKSAFDINKVVCEGFMFGNKETKAFRPDDPATRAELIRSALLLVDIIPAETLRYAPFVDVDINNKFAPYIQKAKDMRILYAMAPDRKIFPDKYVTRLEAISVLANLFGANLDDVRDEDYYATGFQDVFPNLDFGAEAIWAQKVGLLPQYDDIEVTERYFQPNEALPREDLAHWLVTAMNVLANKQDELSSEDY